MDDFIDVIPLDKSLELQKSGIHVASYWTDALPNKELERKLHEAVRLARAWLETARA